MKKEMNNLRGLLFCVTGVYCTLCFLSVGLVAYGALQYDLRLFSVGKSLVPLWLLNPMGLVMPLIALRKNYRKTPFFIHIVINSVCWLVAGVIHACFF